MAAREVPGMSLEDEVHLVMHLRMTGNMLLDAPTSRSTRACPFAARRRPDGPVRGPAPLRHRRRAARQRRARRLLRVRLGVEPLSPDFTAEALRARRAAASSRSRRSCSTRSGSPAWATSTPTRRCSGRRSIRCGRWARSSAPRSRRCATPWWSRSRRASTPGARRSTTTATSDGAEGLFQDRFQVHLREGEPCVRCGTPIKKMRAAGAERTSARAASAASAAVG